MEIDKNTFCVVPFVQLNTRGKGDARVCCSIYNIDRGIPKHITVDEINNETYNNDTEVFNLFNDSINDLWNSKFMKDFRMKMLRGERISNCDFCYNMEASGLGSKRKGKNKKFLEQTLPLLQDYYDREGHVDIMPQWWEIRLSTKCNLSCIMCSPNLSSMMYKEYEKWEKEGKLTKQMAGSLNIARGFGDEYLSESTFFKQQVLDNLKNVLYMEFRGGEVFADKHSVDFMWEIAKTEYAKNISLDISTNATLVSEDIIELLNHFKGGLLRFSIDGYKEQDELIRAHTSWDSIVSSINNATALHGNWNMVTQQCLQTLNCLNMTEVLEFLDEFCKTTNNTRFHIGITSIRGKDFLRHELIPLHEREKEVARLEEFIKHSWLCNHSPHKKSETVAVEGLITALQNPDYTDIKLFKQAKEYYAKLSELRNVDYWKVFPQLKYIDIALEDN